MTQAVTHPAPNSIRVPEERVRELLRSFFDAPLDLLVPRPDLPGNGVLYGIRRS
jgi:hypothetical protein